MASSTREAPRGTTARRAIPAKTVTRAPARKPTTVQRVTAPKGPAKTSVAAKAAAKKVTPVVAKKAAPAPKKAAPVAKKAQPVAKKVAPAPKKAVPVAKKVAPVAKKAAPVAKKAAPKKVAPVAKKAAPKKAAPPAKQPAAKKVASVAKKAATPVATAAPAAKKAPPAKAAPAAKKAAPAPAPAKAAASKPVARRLAVRGDESPWTERELSVVRAELQEDIDRLKAEITHAEHDLQDLLRDSGDGAGDDQADAGAKTFEREQEISVANNAREMLTQSLRALARIDDGTYGLCEICGNPIGKMRLQAFPRATMCVADKQREERR